MGKTQKTITLALWFVVVLGLVGLVALQGRRIPEATKAAAAMETTLPPLWDAPPFRLIDSNAQPFGSDELKGKVWVFRLFFSSCTTVCPGTTAMFRDFDEALTDPSLQIVSVSVDPEKDTPAVLKEYNDAIMAKHPERWHLLTGNIADIKAFAEMMKVPFDKPENHQGRLLLVDRDMRVRGTYPVSEGDASESLKQVIADAKTLLEQPH